MKVFLSSTAQDLVAYRQVADDTILRCSHQSIAMERFGARTGIPVEECERFAAECDLLICIVGHRYGFVPEPGRGSITRREVEAARAAGKDVLVWIVDDAHPWTEPTEQDSLKNPAVLSDPARIMEVAAHVEALEDFKAWLRTQFTFETFTTPDDLGRKLAVALTNYSPAAAKPVAAPRIRGELRIVHALQPAPHFAGRDALVQELAAWAADPASPDRVWSLVAAGGTGKTAVVEQVVRGIRPTDGSVLVWSFYERPDADAFLRECNHLFLGEEQGPAGGRLERLERGLRDGRPHLIVLDGLERVQEDAGGGRARGELSDHTLKLLLRALAAGLGRARALITSRFPLVDVEGWDKRGYRDTRLDDLAPEAAVAVLRGWGVKGKDVELQQAAEQVGYHALSVAVIGSYLRSFADGQIQVFDTFDLDAATGDDPKAAKLARVLGYYAEQLPADERDLLARISVFPRGVTLDLLGVLIDAGGEVAGLLVNATPRLVTLLRRLQARGLAFEYRTDGNLTWTAHPFLRERFRQLLDCPAEDVFAVIAESLGGGLVDQPEAPPVGMSALDRYERLIEATRLAGQEERAYRLFEDALGGYRHLAVTLGSYERGHRILSSFSATGRPEDLATTLADHDRSNLANTLALFAHKLGRLHEADRVRAFDDAYRRSALEPSSLSLGLQNASEVAFDLGQLPRAEALAAEAVEAASDLSFDDYKIFANAFRAAALHALGDIPAAREAFAAATDLEGEPLFSIRGMQHSRHHLDLGERAEARTLADICFATATEYEWAQELPQCHALLARIALAANADPAPHLLAIRDWTGQTGSMHLIIEGHHLSARDQLLRGDLQAASAEVEIGLVHAVACGYRLLQIELLVTLAHIRLRWPDPGAAVQAAREAVDLAAEPSCRYAWGEADAAQVWGEAYFANREFVLSRRAFERALQVRHRIEHPGVDETRGWLQRVL